MKQQFVCAHYKNDKIIKTSIQFLPMQESIQCECSRKREKKCLNCKYQCHLTVCFSLAAVWVLFTRLNRYPDLSPVVLVFEVSFACRPRTGRKSLQTQTPHGPVLPGRTLAPPTLPPFRSPPPAFHPPRTRGGFIERDSLSYTHLTNPWFMAIGYTARHNRSHYLDCPHTFRTLPHVSPISQHPLRQGWK